MIGAESVSVKQSARGRPRRLAAYRELYPEMADYNPRVWPEAALEPLSSYWRRLFDWLWRKSAAWPCVSPLFKAYWPQNLRVRRFRARTDFKDSHWHRFQEAVKAHQRFAQELYAERYAQLGEELRGVW